MENNRRQEKHGDDYQPHATPGGSARAATGELWVSFNARVLDYLKSALPRDLSDAGASPGVVAAPEQSAAAPRKALGWVPVAPIDVTPANSQSGICIGLIPLAPRAEFVFGQFAGIDPAVSASDL